MYSHLDGPIWLPWVLWVWIWFSKPFYKCTLPFGGSNLTSLGYLSVILNFKTFLQVYNSIWGSNLISLSFVDVTLVFKTFLQVSYTSIWASNLTSLDYVGMILIFKGLWRVCSSIWRFILTFLNSIAMILIFKIYDDAFWLCNYGI